MWCYLRVARRSDKEETAMDSGILDITFTLGSEFLAKVSRVLIFDVLDNRFPTIDIEHEFECCSGLGKVILTNFRYSLGHHSQAYPQCSNGDAHRFLQSLYKRKRQVF